jgi:hypothetical protein
VRSSRSLYATESGAAYAGDSLALMGALNLSDEPQRKARNRKPLRPNPVAPWELRAGNLRAFYDVTPGAEPTVSVLAIGIKRGELLTIGRQGSQAMKTIELSQATKPLAEYASELGTEAIVLTSEDQPVAALLSLRGVDKESLALSTNPEILQRSISPDRSPSPGRSRP